MEPLSAAELSSLAGSMLPSSSYGDPSVLQRRDDAIATLLTSLDASGRLPALIAAIDTRQSARLNAYAERMATLAVRLRDPRQLRNGLTAVAVAYETTDDPRDNLTVLSLLWRAAQLLDLDAAGEFHAAAARVPDAAAFFASWPSRKPAHQTIQDMGYLETTDADGFTFRWANDYSIPPPENLRERLSDRWDHLTRRGRD